jgi:hypothetical protein
MTAVAAEGRRPKADGRRADFPILASNPKLHYLDSAATSQKPRAVLDAMRAYYERDNANPHRGAYDLSARATQRYHAARERVARFVGVADVDSLIFVRGTTEGLNLVANAWGRANVERGDEVLLTGMEHHANFVPWQQLALEKGAVLRICELTDDGRIDLDRFASLMGGRTKIVAFNHVSNALGTINPVRARDRFACAGTRAPRDHGLRWRAECPAHARSRGRAGCRFLRVQRPQDAGADGKRRDHRQAAAAGADASLSNGWRHDRVRRRRSHHVERAAAQVRGGDAERR